MKKIVISLLFSFTVMTLMSFSVIKKELNKEWVFKQVRGVNWYPAIVPGVVHLDLMNNKIIEDPYLRMNERSCQWVDKEDWEYKTTFDISDEMYSRSNIRMVFKGLDTYADVYLNDEKVLLANNMFREWIVDCRGKLKKQGNTLRVYFHSPVKMDLPKYDSLPYHYPASNDQSENGGLFSKRISVFARKAPYQYGWDWGPRLVTSGIWRPVMLEAWNGVHIQDVQIFQENVSGKSASVKTVVEFEASENQRGTVSLINAETGQKYAGIQSEFKTGDNKVTVEFVLKNPRLWWSNGLGEQFLYPFKAVVTTEGKDTDNKVLKIGIRSIKLVLEKPNGEKSFHFELNGVPVFMKGANYIPLDNFIPRVTPERYEQMVRSAKDANINMLRVWGGGIYENDIFYDLCDKYGILLWHDFMFACSLYPADSAMLDNIKQEAVQNVKRIRNHVSLALWCGNNEINEAWYGWGWKKEMENKSQSQADKVWGEYESIFHKLLPDVIKEYDPQTSYRESSPLTDNGNGDMHYWQVWHAEAPITDYAKVIPPFMSEYGFQSFPDFNSVKKYAYNPADQDIYSEVMLLHQRNNRGNQLIKSYMEKEYRNPKDFSAFLYMSQVQQAEAIKIAEEAHRRNMSSCMGSLYWQLNDCWPVASWSGIDYYGHWKALHYYTRRAFSEVLVSPFEEKGKLNVYVVSDRLSSSKAVLTVKLINLEGKTVFESSKLITIPANKSSLFFSKQADEILNKSSRNKVVVFAEVKENSKLLSSNTYYLAKTRDIDFPLVKYTKAIIPTESGYEIRLNADKPTKNVFLEIDNSDNLFSDNYFDLVPGQTTVIRVNSKLSITDFEKQLKIKSMVDAY